MKKLSSHYSLIHQQQQCTTSTATKQQLSSSSSLGNHHITSITTTSTTLSSIDTNSAACTATRNHLTVTNNSLLHLHQQQQPNPPHEETANNNSHIDVIVADRSILLNDPLHLYHQYKKRAHQQQSQPSSSHNGGGSENSNNGNHTHNADTLKDKHVGGAVVTTSSSHVKLQESGRREPNPTTTPSPSSSLSSNKKRKKEVNDTTTTTAASSKSSTHHKSHSLAATDQVKPITTASVLPPLPRIKKSSSSLSSTIENDQPSPASLSSSSNTPNNHSTPQQQQHHTISHHLYSSNNSQCFHTPHPEDANNHHSSNKDPSSLFHSNHHQQSINNPTSNSLQSSHLNTNNTALLPSSHLDHPSSINKRIFVGGLKESTTEQDLMDFFSLPPNNYGPVIHCVIMKKWDGRSRGFGFVTFSEESIARKVLNDHKEHPFTMGTHRIDCQAAQGNFSEQSPTATSSAVTSQASSLASQPSHHQQQQPQTLQTLQPSTLSSNVDDQNLMDSFPAKKETCSFDKKRRIFVGGLQPQVTKQAVQDYFSKYGTIEDLQLILNRRTPFAFITYSEEESVNRALDDFYSGVLCKEFPAHDVRRAMPKGSFSFTKQREREMELANCQQSARGGRGPLHRSSYSSTSHHSSSTTTNQPLPEHFDTDGTLNHSQQGNGASSQRKSHLNHRYAPYDMRTASSRRSMPFYVDESMNNPNSAVSPPTSAIDMPTNAYFNGNGRAMVPYVHPNAGTTHHAHVALRNHMDRPPHSIPPPAASVVPPIYNTPPPPLHPHHRPTHHIVDDRYGPKGSPSTSTSFYPMPFYEPHAFPPGVMHHQPNHPHHQLSPPVNGVRDHQFVRSNHIDNISNSSSEENNKHNQFSSRR
ncbi:hypothetical protein C9374_003255 [Naegleria lovaniensis]|uniref:RRM domain-containing protein n=1 Tax=Naegleria lovaniensis TaxID=51637 RepID=A0AA88GRB2_NAELO|nr:uncharacterized protein C9374_003255 [Naegleria lovaniensis]KAG2385440.1 hypothetical protein C9374_003255 [Naegleria lovaniensis]